jgi:hypothetical protein
MTTAKYPLETFNGALVLERDENQKLRQSITHLLLTKYEERVLRPEWGVGVEEFNVVANLPSLLGDLEQTLEANFSDITFSLYGRVDEGGAVWVTVNYDDDSLEIDITT